MKPLDPRLLRYARAARRYVILTAVLGVITAALVIAQSILIANVISPIITGEIRTFSAVSGLIGWTVIVVLVRALVVALQERFAHRSARRAITELRTEVLEHATALGPRWLSAEDHGPHVTTLVTRGLDDLEAYFIRYLPQLLLAATVTPLALIVVLKLDWVSAAIITATIPLIPIFMIVIGRMTQTYSNKRLATMQRLGSQILDLLAGLATLRAFGRQHGPEATVKNLAESHRKATMSTLRVAFLSGVALELITTLSVAGVAVGVGLRLVDGNVTLTTGLAVIMLAPEVYLPLRQVGLHFHASTNGIAAADAAFAVLETPLPKHGTQTCPDLRTSTIELDHLTIHAPGRDLDAPSDLSAAIIPGRITALAGPSGAGKSTTVLTLLNFVIPDSGRVLIGGKDLAEIDPHSLWEQVAWVPQRPVIVPGTVAENARTLSLGAQSVSTVDGDLLSAAAMTGLDAIVETLPQGWDTKLGHGGVGLSVGQRQRLGLTRALMGERPLIILDEPSAHLDAISEQIVLDVVQTLKERGQSVLVIAHRPSLLTIADDIIHVASSHTVRTGGIGA